MTGAATPLYVAVFKIKSLPLTLWPLDERGADVNAATSQGATPVHGAFTLDLLKALLDRGADPSKLDRHGITALMSQATLGEDGAIARLLEDPRIRAILNVRNVPGDTALYWACTHKSDEQQHAQVLLLLQAGADASIKGKKKETPLKMLLRLHPSHRITIALLEEALDAEKTALLIKARCLVKVASTAAPPSYLHSRVTRGQPLPHVAQTPVAGGSNTKKKKDLKLHTMLAFVCGMEGGPEGEGMPRKAFLVVLDFLMPTWDPVRKAINAGGQQQQG